MLQNKYHNHIKIHEIYVMIQYFCCNITFLWMLKCTHNQLNHLLYHKLWTKNVFLNINMYIMQNKLRYIYFFTYFDVFLSKILTNSKQQNVWLCLFPLSIYSVKREQYLLSHLGHFCFVYYLIVEKYSLWLQYYYHYHINFQSVHYILYW